MSVLAYAEEEKNVHDDKIARNLEFCKDPRLVIFFFLVLRLFWLEFEVLLLMGFGCMGCVRGQRSPWFWLHGLSPGYLATGF